MIGLVQRVAHACAKVNGEVIGSIDEGLLVLLAVEPDDTERKAERLLDRISGYRIFADPNGKMNLSLKDVGGELLVVSQFTLAADTKKGMRPSFSSAASPELGERLYDHFVEKASALLSRVQTGRFGAEMEITLTNIGPTTFSLRVE
ncbi:D-tyrosyl-tRNA(Tyr) deacylase [Hahella chejuensis KCTC 2396]|uniref:D-aminoacyl-tRNA deacylase n=1 Tax=Hahella chejuensis (strain KCTC 2396) TaxID=349521 RepID=DTD_HAHCH|nr:D-aminoacyl-tRNA deacylase [Hahella chejuensis]Q2SN53.1 RecName: Full=D-aminoacyl-tRNA deacylase; Short=DTD; AltName: Full=Gly-tRNA(Ala) deacylase [Hahella chejuensis KCTC 2396]ABC27921.1 D-tyrosyl-tRNA(Tyr) deacylase [Hahella chejuensis KCTC 2396]